MKRFFVLALTAMMAMNLMAQEVKETQVKIGDLNVTAYTMTLQKDKKTVQKALEQRLKEAKLKTKKTDGFEASLGKVFSEISSTPVNFYSKVDGNSSNATVTVCAMATDLSANQSNINSNLTRFLQNFAQYVEKVEAAAQLEIEQDNLKKAEKEYKSANSDLEKLQKNTKKDQEKIVDLQKDIEKWQKNIQSAEKEINSRKANIEKNSGNKLTDAQKRVQEAEKNVNSAKTEVEKYRELAK